MRKTRVNSWTLQYVVFAPNTLGSRHAGLLVSIALTSPAEIVYEKLKSVWVAEPDVTEADAGGVGRDTLISERLYSPPSSSS